MDRGPQGEYVLYDTSPESFRAFVPKPLPPEPSLVFDTELIGQLTGATLSAGRLDGITRLLPDVSLFLYFYIRKEAVLSSQIEGTQSSLSDLLLFETDPATGVPLDDVQEVSNYVSAMEHGLRRLKGGFPLSSRLLREIHEVLLARGRGSDKEPGEFRRSQNWVSGTRPGNALFVPPPPDQITSLMGALETFLHNSPLPPLVKAGLAHVQFESIHPFLDGNGRLGRLLVTLLLCSEGVLSQPLLYLSLYFKTNRQRYFELLQKVRTAGSWEQWIRFFLEGVQTTADLAVDTTQRILQLFETDRLRLNENNCPASVLRLHEFLQHRALFTIPKAAAAIKLTQASVGNAVDELQKMQIVRQLPGRRRNRFFVYEEYLRLLDRGTDLMTEKAQETAVVSETEGP